VYQAGVGIALQAAGVIRQVDQKPLADLPSVSARRQLFIEAFAFLKERFSYLFTDMLALISDI
jgi:hypothetical protein